MRNFWLKIISQFDTKLKKLSSMCRRRKTIWFVWCCEVVGNLKMLRKVYLGAVCYVRDRPLTYDIHYFPSLYTFAICFAEFRGIQMRKEGYTTGVLRSRIETDCEFYQPLHATWYWKPHKNAWRMKGEKKKKGLWLGIDGIFWTRKQNLKGHRMRQFPGFPLNFK